jgi:hypothetical protein
MRRRCGVNLQLLMSFCGIAVLALVQAGCATSPTTTSTDIRPGLWEAGDRPAMMFPGASRSEVKALAMGAARTRGWNILDSTEDRMVVGRPLDPASALARQLGRSDGQVEVTTYFAEQRGGLQVAMDAEVITQAPGSDRAPRTDVTESLRPALTDSLESLHSSWSKNRSRVANAAPPIGGALADEDDTQGGDLASERDPAAWTNEAAAEIIAPPATAPRIAEPRAPTPSPAPSTAVAPVAQRYVPPPTPVTASAPVAPIGRAPTTTATTWPTTRATSSSIASLPSSRPPAGRPAPVVDASAIPQRRVSPPVSTQPMTLPEPIPDPSVAAEAPLEGDSMLALYPSSTDVSWSYYAEQYARLRGCNVAPTGAILIDSRTDGEILKVPCNGADSMIVQCQNGDCRGLL